MDITTKAASAAAKICCNGCMTPLTCKNSITPHPHAGPCIGKLTECPLAKYGLAKSDDLPPWHERHYNETHLDEEDIFALCANCQHAEMSVDDDGEPVANRKDLRDCCDCPVKFVEDELYADE